MSHLALGRANGGGAHTAGWAASVLKWARGAGLVALRVAKLLRVQALASVGVIVALVCFVEGSGIVLEDLNTPEGFAKQGYSGAVMSRQLHDALRDILRAAYEPELTAARPGDVATAAALLSEAEAATAMVLLPQDAPRVLQNLPASSAIGYIDRQLAKERKELRIRLSGDPRADAKIDSVSSVMGIRALVSFYLARFDLGPTVISGDVLGSVGERQPLVPTTEAAQTGEGHRIVIRVSRPGRPTPSLPGRLRIGSSDLLAGESGGGHPRWVLEGAEFVAANLLSPRRYLLAVRQRLQQFVDDGNPTPARRLVAEARRWAKDVDWDRVDARIALLGTGAVQPGRGASATGTMPGEQSY